MSLLSLGLTWEDSAPRGFQVGRAAALLEHAHRREARAFKKLVKYLHQRTRRADAEKWAREYEQIKRRRLKRRLARAAARPPCPGCGGTVGRGRADGEDPDVLLGQVRSGGAVQALV